MSGFDQVIVVGAGPAGLLLALFLGRKGIPVTVLESAPQLSDQPRATHYAPPAVRELRRAGIIDNVLSEGFLPNKLTWRKRDGTRLATLTTADLGDHPERLVCLPLNKLCRILYTHLLKCSSVQIQWSAKAIDLGQDQDRAWVDAETTNGKQRFQADYIIGCDGASSQIRRCLFGDGHFPGHTWEKEVVATNVYYDFDRFAWDDVNYIIDPDHWYMAARISRDGMWRVSYGERGSYTRQELIAGQPLKFEHMLPGNPKTNEYRITNCSPYKIHQRCAERMRVGRFLLAADAAHLCNPFGGMGLTGGIVDVGNLYDCLVGIYDGKADDTILDKYDEIRRQKYKEIVDPLSTENLQRLFESGDGVSPQTMEFFELLSRAESDKALSQKIQLDSNQLQHDFTQYYK